MQLTLAVTNRLDLTFAGAVVVTNYLITNICISDSPVLFIFQQLY